MALAPAVTSAARFSASPSFYLNPVSITLGNFVPGSAPAHWKRTGMTGQLLLFVT